MPANSLEPVYQLWGWVLLVWSLYRYVFKLPEWADELIIKPLVFVVPVWWYVRKKERRTTASLGLTAKNLFPSLYIGLGFGLIFALEGIAANAIKYGKMTITPIDAFTRYGMIPLLLFSLATAFSEELISRGFLFQRIMEKTKNLPYAIALSTVLFVLLHVPILATTLKFTGGTLLLFVATNVVLSIANSLLLFSTRSLVAPILVHVFWNMTVALYL